MKHSSHLQLGYLLLLVHGPIPLPAERIADTVGDDYPGEDFPYEDPPETFGEVEFLQHRSPCPAINTLANHNLIRRDGKHVGISKFALAMQDAFGISSAFIIHLVNQSKKAGLVTSNSSAAATTTTTQTNSTTTATPGETFNLFDLYEHNVVEHDASLVRQDEYFEPFAQFSQTLFDDLVGQDDSGLVTRETLLDHRLARIEHSKKHNPQVLFKQDGGGDPVKVVLAGESFLFFLFGTDANLTTVRKDNLQYFLMENRFPPSFTPRSRRGLPIISAPEDPLFQEMIGFFLPPIEEAIQPSSSQAAKVWLTSLAFVPCCFCMCWLLLI